MIPTDPPEVSPLQWAGIKGLSAFDVGAHLGENIPFLQAAGCGQITAFEPFPSLYDRLAARWWPQVECVPLAAWDRDGMLELTENDGMLGVLAGSVRREVGCTTLDSEAASRGYPDVVASQVGCTVVRIRCPCPSRIPRHTAETIRHPHYPPGSVIWHSHGWIKALRP